MKNSINLSIVALSILFFTSIQAEKKLSPQAEATFQQIQKIWNSHEKTLRDFNKNVINVGMSKIQEDVQNTLSDGPGSIDAPEILNLINSIKDQKKSFNTITRNIAPANAQALKKVFDTAKDFFSKLIQTQELIEKNNLEKELIGITTSYKNLAKGILVIVKDEAATRLGMVYPVPADEAQALDLLKSDKTFEINIKK